MNKTNTVQDWEQLAEAIREELREYAWLLSLMDRQQKAILLRDIPAMGEASEEIETQTATVEELRSLRMDLMDRQNERLGLSRGYSIRGIAEHAPAVRRGLFLALADEAHALVTRLQRRTRQNHLLLSRATEFTGQMIQMLRPGSQTRTYNHRGALTTRSGLRGSVVHTAV